MTLDELTAYLERQGFTRVNPNEEPPVEEKQTEPEQQNNFATKDDLSALQSAIAELSSTIKANNINTQYIESPKQESAEDILGALLRGKEGKTS